MIEDDEIIFNDANGSDKDLNLLEYFMYSIYHADCNNWDDPILFSIYRSEFAYNILYDNSNENIRYSISIINHPYEYGLYEVCMSTGLSWNGSENYKLTNKLSFFSCEYDYKYFLIYQDNELDQVASIEKLKKLVDRFMNLKVFL